MHKKNNLFTLIKSLSPAEKRYFKSFIGKQSTEKKYLKLFNVIDALNSYDEAIIRKFFATEKFTRQLHVMKIYLHATIMKRLRSFYSEASTSLKIKDCLKNIEVYFIKELFAHCSIEIARAEKLARAIEDDVALLEILSWKRKLHQNQSPVGFLGKEIIDQQSGALARLTHNNNLWKELLDPMPVKAFDTRPQAAPTLNSKVLAYHIQYRDAVRLGKSKEAKRSLEELAHGLEKRLAVLNEDPTIYLTTLNNLISFLVFNKETKEALKIVSKAKTFYQNLQKVSRNNSNFRLILRTYNIELEIYRDTELLDDAVNLIQQIVKLLDERRGNAPESYLLSLWFQFANIYFQRKDFRSSLHWINEILNCSFADKRRDLHLQAQLLNLVVHFELRNFFVMRYFVASTMRSFKKNKALLPYHKIVLSFFIKVSGEAESTHPLLFQKLHKDLIAAAAAVPKSELDYINWENWIRGKLKGRARVR